MSGGAERAVGHSLLRVVCVRVRDGYELACKPAGAPPVIATDESDLTATQTARPQLGSTAGAPTRPRPHVRGFGLDWDEGRRSPSWRQKPGSVGRAGQPIHPVCAIG